MRFPALLLCTGVALGSAVTVATAATVTAERTWRHPNEWNQRTGPLDKVTPTIAYSEARMMHGDDPRWAEPGWNDDDWPSGGFFWFPARAGIFWVRFRVRNDEGHAPLPTGFAMTTASSYEIFWDGVRIGRNGVPGNSRADEVPGDIDFRCTIPESLTGPGEHVVTLRLSNHWTTFPNPLSGFRVRLGEPRELEWRQHAMILPLVLGAGALSVCALVAGLFWWLADRRNVLLWLIGLCIAAPLMQGLIAYRFVVGYPYPWHHPALVTINVLVAALGICLVGFAFALFAVPHRRRWLLLLVPVLAAAAWLSPARLNREGDWIMLTCFAVALVGSTWAMLRRLRGARVMAAGMALTVVLRASGPTPYVLSDLFPNFLPTLLACVAAVALRVRDERRAAREARLTAARLEIEVLRKNLQPHFLLNTLTVVTEVIESDPAGAVRLIEDLAAEFRLLAAMSAEKTVPLAHEIALCRAHLRVMSVRSGRECRLDVSGPESIAVPPAVVLTLLENGFSHQRVQTGPRIFTLRMAGSAEEGWRLVLLSPGETRVDEPARPAGSGGTGLRYVRARLEEYAPGAWELTHEAVPAGWETTIAVRAVPRRAPGA
jgi:hypothetical protein